MTNKELVDKCLDIAKNYKTLYVMGCFGAPLTGSNVSRYCTNHTYNKQAARTKMIKAAGNQNPPVYGFDCVNLIKAVLWGWTGNVSKSYGGATYASNGVPDVSADGMIAKCNSVSTTGWASMTVGEVVWMSGHIGVYIGDGLAVECSPRWANKVQITAVANIGSKSGYNARKWTKHGRLPYITYVANAAPSSSQGSTSTSTGTASSASGSVKATGTASSFSKSLAGTYTVTASSLNVRNAAGTSAKVLVAIPNGTKVQNYGYYSTVSGKKWLYVQFEYKGVTYTGFCSSAYLKK